MINFIGTYECKIDDKGRLKVPVAFIKQLQSISDKNFVIKRSVFQPCLEIYPMNTWQKMMEKVNKLNPFIKKNADFTRMFIAGVKTVELDTIGRFQIAKDLIVFANLKKEIVITSPGQILEVWDKESYEAVINNKDIDFSTLAEEVMGQKTEEE